MKPIAHFLMPSGNPEQLTPHSHLPRVFRKALRVTTPKQPTAHRHTDLTEHFRRDYYNDTYHNQNLYTMEYDADEFGDYDDELEGLTRKAPTFDASRVMFAQQLAFVGDQSKHVTAVCSRRAGKTVAAAGKLIATAQAKPGSVCLYLQKMDGGDYGLNFDRSGLSEGRFTKNELRRLAQLLPIIIAQL